MEDDARYCSQANWPCLPKRSDGKLIDSEDGVNALCDFRLLKRSN